MDKKRIYIVNGPNLNRLGQRDAAIYGSETLGVIEKRLIDKFEDAVELVMSQHNGEGDIIDRLQLAADDAAATLGVVINPGAYAHYSYAIADAIADLAYAGVKCIEVHISNIAAREQYRRQSVTAVACHAMISGFGTAGYDMAVNYLLCHE